MWRIWRVRRERVECDGARCHSLHSDVFTATSSISFAVATHRHGMPDECEPCVDNIREAMTEVGIGIAPKSTPPAFFFAKGPNTYHVEAPLPVAARKRLVAALEAKGCVTGAVLLRGGVSATRNDTDHEELFRQESYFAHLFGVTEPDCWGIIELPSGRTTLLVPRLGPEYRVWMGELHSQAHFISRYHVEACAYTDEVQATLSTALATSPGPVHILQGVNSDSGLRHEDSLPTAEGVPDGAKVEGSTLYDLAAECRVIKTSDVRPSLNHVER